MPHGYCSNRKWSDTASTDRRPTPHRRQIPRIGFLKTNNIRKSASCRVLEKQFHLPTAFIDLGDHQSRQLEVIGEELQSTLVLDVQVADAPQRIRTSFRRFDGG